MENNLTVNKPRNGTRLELLTKTMTQSELQSHAQLVELRLEIISRKYDRFGWDQISKEIRTMLKADWTESLLNYSIDEIDTAIKAYVSDTKNKKAAHEGQIKAIIVASRQRVVASQPKPEPEAQPREQMTPERRAAILEEFGRDNDAAQIRQFSDKATEVV